MPHCAAVPRVLRPKFRNGVNGLSLRPRNTTVEAKPGLRQGRRKTLNPTSKANLNIHERPVRKKKKTPKYETYERDRGIVPPPPETPPIRETNVLLALGLRPVPNGVINMHVVEGDCDKPKSPVAAESPSKSVSVSAVTTTVDDAAPTDSPSTLPASPKANGVCDSAGELSKPSSRRNSKESVAEQIKKERLSPPAEIKTEAGVESTAAQDLTVTCTSSLDPPPKCFPSAKFISISVEQCQGTSSTQNKVAPGRKRSTKSTDSDEGSKRGRMDDREASVRSFVEQASSGSLDELQRHAETLQQEIHGLSALARTKELEWNEVVHSKKLKEEMYLRLVRKKQIMMIMLGSGSRPPDDQIMEFNMDNRLSDLVTNDEVSMNRVRPRLPSNLTITKSQSGASQQLQRFLMQPQRLEQHHQYANGGGGSRQRSTSSKSSRSTPFPILPKPVDNGRQQAGYENAMKMQQSGFQGPIRDVKSLIADFRQTHPHETIPKRGRRMKGSAENLVSSSRSVMSMSSMALGSGSQVRTVGSTSEETSRPSSADSSRSDAMAFKDVYVQYSKMNSSSSGKAPPPYPEVTLHPVLPGNSQSPPPTSSLLHGILTKQAAAAAAAVPVTSTAGGQKSTAFSPTLARLLTTPDQPSTTTTVTTVARAGTSASSSSANVSISELLSTSKTRNELTITPVVHAQPAKPREEPVAASHDEDCEEQDRLVIDEGDDVVAVENGPEMFPECQGCHARPAQFVCAGCGNQWYCSRDCQVTAWDAHSEVCAG